MGGFGYALELPDGESVEPMICHRARRWHVGDTFLSGPDLQRLRILAIDSEAPGVIAGYADGIWIVEPIMP